MTKKDRTTYTSNKINDLQKLAEAKGLGLSELIDRYIILAEMIDKRTSEGKRVFIQKDGELEKEIIPVREFLGTGTN